MLDPPTITIIITNIYFINKYILTSIYFLGGTLVLPKLILIVKIGESNGPFKINYFKQLALYY